MTKIENPNEYEIVKFDCVSRAAVYKGSFDELARADELKWRDYICPYRGAIKLLTLDEIKNQLSSPIITIFLESPLSGKILQYGNYGDEWWSVGETAGYA